MRLKYREITKIMNDSIAKDEKEMAEYGLKSHLEVPLENGIEHH